MWQLLILMVKHYAGRLGLLARVNPLLQELIGKEGIIAVKELKAVRCDLDLNLEAAGQVVQVQQEKLPLVLQKIYHLEASPHRRHSHDGNRRNI